MCSLFGLPEGWLINIRDNENLGFVSQLCKIIAHHILKTCFSALLFMKVFSAGKDKSPSALSLARQRMPSLHVEEAPSFQGRQRLRWEDMVFVYSMDDDDYIVLGMAGTQKTKMM